MRTDSIPAMPKPPATRGRRRSCRACAVLWVDRSGHPTGCWSCGGPDTPDWEPRLPTGLYLDPFFTPKPQPAAVPPAYVH
ncbi:hypothetical protein GCM10022221_67770 [Actinocorallia aurea]